MIFNFKDIRGKKSSLVKAISWFLILMGIPYVGLFLHFELYKSASAMALLYATAFLAIFFTSIKKDRVSKFILVGGVSGILFLYSVILGRETGAPLIFFPIISLPLVLFYSEEKIEMTVACSIPIIFRYAYDIIDRFYPNLIMKFHEFIHPNSQFIIYEFAVFTAFLFTFAFVCFFYVYEREYLKTKEEKARQDKEIRLARDIQLSLLPKEFPIVHDGEIVAASAPAKKVSGDIYFINKIDDDTFDVIIADIVGKGLPACLHMVVLKSILSAKYTEKQTPRELVESLNATIEKDSVFDKYLPIVVCRFSMKKHKLYFCNAGHEPAMHINESGKITMLEANNPVLGLEIQPYVQSEIQFDRGDTVYLYTDGLPDCKSVSGNLYKDVFENDTAIKHLNATELLDEIMEFSGGHLRDDVTIVSVNRRK